MFNLIKKVKAASEGDHSLDWLRPFMSKRSIKAGEILCRKGENASDMYFVLEGRLHLEEINMDMEPPDQKRTQTVICTDDGSVLEIAYNRIAQICHQIQHSASIFSAFPPSVCSTTSNGLGARWPSAIAALRASFDAASTYDELHNRDTPIWP
jgi:hypothetical protein